MKPENKALELNDKEKAIYEVLKKEKSIELGALKTASGLSNKAWNKAVKGLTKLRCC